MKRYQCVTTNLLLATRISTSPTSPALPRSGLGRQASEVSDLRLCEIRNADVGVPGELRRSIESLKGLSRLGLLPACSLWECRVLRQQDYRPAYTSQW